MKRKPNVISYRKCWSKTGTVYDQTITITDDDFQTINNAIQEEIKNGYPGKHNYSSTSGYAEAFLKPFPCDAKTLYTNHTQRNFFKKYLPLDIILRMKDRNTVFVVVK